MKHSHLIPGLYEYMLDISLREHPVLQALREDTAKLPLSVMQVAPEQGQFMQFLLQLLSAKKVLELGTFTGYSALAMALALPDDGLVITCDINEEWTSKAHYFWREAKQDKKIELRLAPALTSLEQLLAEGHAKSFDFIFIDADKTNYVNYYELALQLIHSQGVIAIDNIFWNGKVINREDDSAQTQGIRRLNDTIKQDSRVEVSLVPIADGLFLIKPCRH
jgi:predicted O-methyltransferase YrrM